MRIILTEGGRTADSGDRSTLSRKGFTSQLVSAFIAKSSSVQVVD